MGIARRFARAATAAADSAPQVVGGGQGYFPMRFELAATGQRQRFHIADAVGLQIKLDTGAVEEVLNLGTVFLPAGCGAS